MVGKRSGGPWYSIYKTRLKFERNAVDEYPSLTSKKHKKSGKKWLEYIIKIHLKEFYITRIVSIKMFPNKDASPEVKVDGPKCSPHRYKNGELCMWYPKAPTNERWVFNDGLLHLIVIIEAHLFREEWWRETGEWLGPERSHQEISKNKN